MCARKSKMRINKYAYYTRLVEGYRRLSGANVEAFGREIIAKSDPALDTLDMHLEEFLRLRRDGQGVSIRAFCSANRLTQSQFERRLHAGTPHSPRVPAGEAAPAPAECMTKTAYAYYSRHEVQQALYIWAAGRHLAQHFRQGALRLGLRKPDDILALATSCASSVPTFHASVGRYERSRLVAFDLVAEVDYKGDWQACFKAVRPLVHALRSAGVDFMVKFSGHSSAHVIIPCKGYDYRNASKAFFRCLPGGVRGCDRLDLSFVEPKHFLRMPYSLHEKTGLVSLPLTFEQFETFDPSDADPECAQVQVDLTALSRLMAADNSGWLREVTGQ